MGRTGLSAAQKRELWERWKRGQSLNDIARADDLAPGDGERPDRGPVHRHRRRRAETGPDPTGDPGVLTIRALEITENLEAAMLKSDKSNPPD
jgi:hypothetical protein